MQKEYDGHTASPETLTAWLEYRATGRFIRCFERVARTCIKCLAVLKEWWGPRCVPQVFMVAQMCLGHVFAARVRVCYAGSIHWHRHSNDTQTCKQLQANARKCFFDGYELDDHTGDFFRFAFQLVTQNQTNATTPATERAIPVNFHIYQMGSIGKAKIGLCILILLGTLGCIAAEIIHRTLLALLGSLMTLGLLLWCDMMPLLKEVVAWIDVSTLGLLFGKYLCAHQCHGHRQTLCRKHGPS